MIVESGVLCTAFTLGKNGGGEECESGRWEPTVDVVTLPETYTEG